LGDAEASQHSREQFSHLDRPSSSARLLVQNLSYDFRFVIACLERQLVYGSLQFAQDAIQWSVVFVMESSQFFHDGIGGGAAGVPQGLISGYAGETQTSEVIGNLDPQSSFIDTFCPGIHGASAEVGIETG